MWPLLRQGHAEAEAKEAKGAARPQTVKAVPRGQKLILFGKKQRGVAPAARGRRVSLLPAESEGVEKNGFSQKMVFRKIRGYIGERQ